GPGERRWHLGDRAEPSSLGGSLYRARGSCRTARLAARERGRRCSRGGRGSALGRRRGALARPGPCRRLWTHGFVAEIQVRDRVDVFRCAGHRFPGRLPRPSRVYPNMPTRHRLENGLTLVHEPQGAAHVVAFQIWVNVGGADERADEAGLAHLHEHMLFKGTARRGPGEIARDIEAHGGEVNAWTSWDHTVYHTVMASQFAREGLDVLADAVRFPAFDPSELARECEVVVEEIKRAEDTPARRASRDLFAESYQVHPYRLPVLGTPESVRATTRDRILGFYRRHYTPEAMTLIAVGDVSLDSVCQWAEELLGGDWRRPRAPGRHRAQEPARTGRHIHVVPDEAKEAWL